MQGEAYITTWMNTLSLVFAVYLVGWWEAEGALQVKYWHNAH